ncbi:MAG TPA: pitrilysin family protein, partial [Terriglobales bacterium]|nr:pitrilysin family protein [Terriglobales bacterium]
VQEERRLRTEDQPVSALAELTSAIAYLVHPYRRPVVGWMQDIQRLTRQDLVDYYRLYYVPNNAFIVATGDFVSAEILQRIKTAFGDIPRGSEPPNVQVEEPVQKGERRAYLRKEAELPFMLMYYHAPNLTSPDSYALDLLTVIMAGGRSSRMYQNLVYEKRLVRSVDADYDRLSIDPTVFSVASQLFPGIKAADVEQEIDGLVAEIQSHLISERELQKAKNQIEAAFVFGRDSIFGQAIKIGFYEAAGNWRLMDEYITGIRKVTREDIRRVAKKYLDHERRTVGTLIPTEEKTQ